MRELRFPDVQLSNTFNSSRIKDFLKRNYVAGTHLELHCDLTIFEVAICSSLKELFVNWEPIPFLWPILSFVKRLVGSRQFGYNTMLLCNLRQENVFGHIDNLIPNQHAKLCDLFKARASTAASD